MNTRTSKYFKIAAWTVFFLVAPVITVLFWAHIGLATVIIVPLVLIAIFIRAIVNELRGKRDPYVAGVADLSRIPQKPKRFRYFS